MTHLAPPPLRFPAPTRRRARRRRWLLAGGGVVALVAAVVLAGPWFLTLVRADVLPGTTVGALDVGGVDEGELLAALADHAAERAATPLTVRRGLVEGRVTDGPAEVVSTAGDAGYRLDVDATAAAVLGLGRQANPLDAWRDHLATLRDGTAIEPVESVDVDVLAEWAQSTAETLGLEPIEGTIAFEGTTVVRTEPEPGVAVDAEALAGQVGDALLPLPPEPFDAPLVAVAPVTTAADVDAVEALATRAVSAPVELARNDGRLVLEPQTLAELLFVVQQDSEPRLVLDLDWAALRDVVDAAVIEGFEREPVDAEIRLAGGQIQISESTDGFRFDATVAATQILALATGDGERSATLEGRTIRPDLSTDDARDLRIVEPTGTFTTYFTPGQSRVQNIRRIAELVNGVVLLPGESFSVNGHVGRRTVEKGFAPGGAIFEGEFVEQIGGGVSQFATTMYNAAYFGGYELVRYKAHSYYISRYPMGREATLDYPNVDLEIRNSSPYGLLIEATSTPSSVTVTTWGTPWVEVESQTGRPFNVRSGRVRDGFDVVDTRVLRFPDGREEREERFTRYLPEN